MIKLKKIILVVIYSLTIFSSTIAVENKILFKVDNEIITSIDILTEINYLITINKDFSKMPKKQVFEIAKKSLIREKIKEIELKKIFKEIKVENEFLNNLLNISMSDPFLYKNDNDAKSIFNKLDFLKELVEIFLKGEPMTVVNKIIRKGIKKRFSIK